MTVSGKDESWAIRLLRAMPHPGEPTPDEMLAGYRAAVRRYETDPAYRAHIDQLIADIDAQIDAEDTDEL